MKIHQYKTRRRLLGISKKVGDRKLYVWGTGKGANEVLESLEKHGIQINGIIVSSVFKTKDEYKGYKLYSIDDVSTDDSYVIVATLSLYTDIFSSLFQHGFNKDNIYCPFFRYPRKIIYENRNLIFDTPLLKKQYIKSRIFYYLKRLFYNISTRGYSPFSIEKKQYYVSICAIFKNEAPYLKEWIEFHKIIGIEHFYLYNNNSDDNYRDVLKPYIRDNIVTLVQWPMQQGQMDAYKDCVNKYKNQTNWIGFIDLDEFVVPKSYNNIKNFLRPIEKKTGALFINWRLFGTSGLMNRDKQGLVTEDFRVCWPKYDSKGKCFYNTAYKLNENTVFNHWCMTKYKGHDIFPYDVYGKFCFNNIHTIETDFPLQIDHYFTKSLEEYKEKQHKGDAFFEKSPKDEQYFFYHEMKCTAIDCSAYKYLIRIKQILENE